MLTEISPNKTELWQNSTSNCIGFCIFDHDFQDLHDYQDRSYHQGNPQILQSRVPTM